MIGAADLLKATEAAAVAEVEVRDVNRVIDEAIIPERFVGTNGARRVLALACPLISFYVDSASRLTATERRSAIAAIASRLSTTGPTDARGENLRIRDDFLTIDLGPFFAKSERNFRRLAAAREMVENDPHVLGGTPVLKGTRVPVYDVAASVEAGIDEDRILEAYPSLTTEMLDLAALYARANPMRGRPPAQVRLPPGATVVEDIVVARRGAGG